MSTPSSSSTATKRRHIKENPFQRLTARTEELSQVSLKDAYLVNIALVELNPNQPRKHIDQERLHELSEDIKVRGILQPPIVRPSGEKYQLIVGERRYRAALLANLTEIPVIVKDLSDQDAQVVSLVENIQREDLDIADEAHYFKMLQDEYSLSIRDIAELVNKSKSYVDARLQLVKYPRILQDVQKQKLGLHEATLLARLERQAQVESLETVREKDSSPTDQNSVREKDNFKDFSPASRSFLRQCRSLLDLSNNMAAKLHRTSEAEREAAVATIQELENELSKLKQRLRKQR